MNLFEKIAKEKRKEKSMSAKEIAQGLGAAAGGAAGVSLGFTIPSMMLSDKIVSKPVLKDLKKQEIMDYYNKTYGSNLVDIDEYVTKHPEHSHFFNKTLHNELSRVQALHQQNPIKSNYLGINTFKNTDKLKQEIERQGLPKGKKWIATFTPIMNAMDGAATTHPNFGVHVVDNRDNKAVAAHELGHLSDDFVSIHPLGSRSAALSNLSGFGTFYGAIKGGLKGEDMNNTELALTAAPTLPSLVAETKANWRAARAIHALRGTKGLREALPTLLFSQGAYTALPFIPYVTNKLSQKIHNKIKGKK